MKYRHVFFDLDHTLWDFDTNARLALEDLYQEFELAHKHVTPFENFYQHYLAHNAVLWDRFHKGYITAEELKWKRMWRTLLEFKIGDETLARAMSVRFLELLPSKTALFPHTHELLTYLKEKSYELHLITNGFEQTQWNKIRNSGIAHYFSEVITSEGSNSLKPHREIFEYALQRAAASATESIMIGDNPDADIQGAINAGWDNVFVNHIQTTITQVPTYTVTSLDQLMKLL
jgi:putative hydrolase of the HAD superfamily